MFRVFSLMILGLLLHFGGQNPDDDAPPNPEMQREEIVNLETEAARAIQTNTGTFFRRVYADDFAGTLSHGQSVNKTSFISAVQTGEVKYDAFIASDVKVRLFRSRRLCGRRAAFTKSSDSRARCARCTSTSIRRMDGALFRDRSRCCLPARSSRCNSQIWIYAHTKLALFALRPPLASRREKCYAPASLSFLPKPHARRRPDPKKTRLR
jgi:hypothetical protein